MPTSGSQSVIVFLAILSYIFHVTQAEKYVTVLNVSDITTSSALLSWGTPDNTTDIGSYVLMRFVDGQNILNETTITTLSTTSHQLENLHYQRIYRYDILTLDQSDSPLGNATVSFVTLYEPLNRYALAAIGVAVTIFVLYILFFIAGKKCDPRQNSDQWKKEILKMQEMEKEQKRKEKQKKISVQVENHKNGIEDMPM